MYSLKVCLEDFNVMMLRSGGACKRRGRYNSNWVLKRAWVIPKRAHCYKKCRSGPFKLLWLPVLPFVSLKCDPVIVTPATWGLYYRLRNGATRFWAFSLWHYAEQASCPYKAAGFRYFAIVTKNRLYRTAHLTQQMMEPWTTYNVFAHFRGIARNPPIWKRLQFTILYLGKT